MARIPAAWRSRTTTSRCGWHRRRLDRLAHGNHLHLRFLQRDERARLFLPARARDNAFNLEAWPPDYDTTTYVDNQAPTSSVAALPATSPATFTVNWSGSDPGSSGIASYDVQVRDGGGAWTTWQSAVTSTSAPYTGLAGHTYGFRSRAREIRWQPGSLPLRR